MGNDRRFDGVDSYTLAHAFPLPVIVVYVAEYEIEAPALLQPDGSDDKPPHS